LDIGVRQATAEAAENGAQLSVLVLDRVTDQTVSANNIAIATASVAKLFIADDLLMPDLKGEIQLSPDDRKALDTMLRSSDNNAGEEFWDRDGGDAIVTRVAARYGLGTAPPPDGRWWNTSAATGCTRPLA
jgi:hypothetical protein